MVSVRSANYLDIEPILKHQKDKDFLISLASADGIEKWMRDKKVWAESQKKLADAVETYRLLVAEDGGDVVGYALFREPQPKKWDIELMNVHKDMQKKGIGTALLEGVHKAAKRNHAEEIRVRPDAMAVGF